MSEEEKEAINFIKELKEFSVILTSYQFCNGKFRFDEEDKAKIDIALNYIDKLQKENEDMREELQMYVDTDVMILQKELKDSINARFELQRRINKLQKELEHKQETIDKILKDLEEFYKKYDVISKDKIRNKIKELAEGRNYIIVNAEVISIQTLLDLLELLEE